MLEEELVGLAPLSDVASTTCDFFSLVEHLAAEQAASSEIAGRGDTPCFGMTPGKRSGTPFKASPGEQSRTVSSKRTRAEPVTLADDSDLVGPRQPTRPELPCSQALTHPTLPRAGD